MTMTDAAARATAKVAEEEAQRKMRHPEPVRPPAPGNSTETAKYSPKNPTLAPALKPGEGTR